MYFILANERWDHITKYLSFINIYPYELLEEK